MWHVDADLGGDGSADTVELDGDEGLDDLMIGGSAGTVSEVGNTAPSVGITGVVAGGMRTPFITERFPDADVSMLQDPSVVADAIRFVLTPFGT